MNGPQALKVLCLSGAPFQAALRINRDFDRCNLATALERNSASFCDVLAVDTLAAEARRRLERQLLFICPLLGLVGPSDLVPDYRCPIGARLPGVGSLHKFWKQPMTETLNRLCRDRIVVSFLPARLRALWEPDGRCLQIVTMRFYRHDSENVVGETAAVPRLTAEAVKFITEQDARTIADLTRFHSSDGHSYCAAHSETSDEVRHLSFVR